MSSHTKIQKEILETLHKSVETGLIRLSAGNISVRLDDGNIAITPAGLPYDQMVPADILIVDKAGKVVKGKVATGKDKKKGKAKKKDKIKKKGNRKPSSETPMHLYILNNLPDVNVVFHSHSVNAMTFATLGKEIPMINLEVLICGGPIPVTPWACPGSEKAGREVVKLLKDRPRLRSVLLRSHGLVSVGSTLSEAYSRAMDTETGAQVYYQALQIGKPVVISNKERTEVYKTYGL